MSFTLLFLRIAAIMLGLLCLSISIFLYENQEGKIQSRLEALWIKIDDLQKATISKHLGFVRVISEAMLSIINRIFGERAFSLQSVCVSACYGAAIVYFCIYLVLLIFTKFARRSYPIELIDIFYIASLAFIYGTIPGFIKGRKALFVWAAFLGYLLYKRYIQDSFTFSLTNVSLTINSGDEVITRLIPLIIPFAGSLVLIFYISILRKSLLKASKADSLIRPGIILLLNSLPVFLLSLCFVFFVIILAVLSIMFPSTFDPNRGSKEIEASILAFLTNLGWIEVISFLIMSFFLILAFISIFFLLSATFFVLLSISMLLHRLGWPLIERPIYLLQRNGIVKRHKLTATCGLMLITAGAGKMENLATIIEMILPF
jgi:hypothetical protein